MKKIICVVLSMVLGFSALGLAAFATESEASFPLASPTIESQPCSSNTENASMQDFPQELSSSSIQLVTLEEPIPHEAKLLEDIGSISTKQSLKVNGIDNNLFCTFDDPISACEKLADAIPEFLDLVQSTGNLDTFSYTNWTEYAAIAVDTYIGQYENASELSKQKAKFMAFMDIIENSDIDEEISTMLNQRSSINLQELSLMLPESSAIAAAVQHDVSSATRSTTPAQQFNKEKGNEYAWKNARSFNESEYGICYADVWHNQIADCTNFASQILENGDINQHDESPNVDSGWWHKKTLFSHSYSKTWMRADDFVRFMGHSDDTQNFNTFSRNVARDYFISIDFGNDGSWDHMGYITTMGTYNQYNGQYYTDFVVAQHTTNYLEWVSSDENGWENYDQSGKYCIVRKQ